jgi:hypothetical protein
MVRQVSDFKIKCQKCEVELPIFNEKGQHNFCPASTPDGGIVNLCMKCKMDEVVEKWKNP